MSTSNEIITIKVGGSIFERGTIEQVNNLVETLKTIHSKKSFIIIVGGGEFAEQVRNLQVKYSFDDETAHWLAIRAMEQQAIVLQSFIVNSFLVSVHNFKKELENNTFTNEGIPILLVMDFMRELSKLEHNWNTTSDAIAVEISNYLGIKEIIFVKDVDGVLINGKLIDKISCEKLNGLDSSPLDRTTPVILSKFPLKAQIMNGFYPKRLEEYLLLKKKIVSTEIIV